jgi:UPF0755 protein
MRVRLFKLAILLVVAGVLGAGGWLLGYRTFTHTPLVIPQEGMPLEILPGNTFTSVAKHLKKQGGLANTNYFLFMVRLHAKGKQLKSGEYLIAPGTTPPQLLQQLGEGRVRQHAITLVEGWNFHQVMNALMANPDLKHTLLGLDDAQIMNAIGYPGVHPEGRFFPDTYHFPRGLSDVEFLRRAYRAMEERLAYEWAQRDAGLPLKNSYEALILASIVEKETGQPSERAKIAGVFVRRLEIGMRLQTDPTVIYGLGESFDGNLRRRDLEGDSPYNTYRIKGLPPTPIAMPGGESLHAALHPAPGKALYFVAKGNGEHYFSATLEEHNRAVAEFQLKGHTTSRH